MGVRISSGAISGFIALTAIGGGLALLFGAEAKRIPLAWLQGTPFTNYAIPALILAIVVGGSALVASITIFIGHRVASLASLAAGLVMMGYITVEVLILKQVPPGPTPVEIFYFGLGLILFVLAAITRMAE